jgi:hypothetical protein
MYRENIVFRGWQAFAVNVSLKSEMEQARGYQCWIITTPRNLAIGMHVEEVKESFVCVFGFHTSLCLTMIFILQTFFKAELQ